MPTNRYSAMIVAFMTLAASILACNLPTPRPSAPQTRSPTATSYVAPTFTPQDTPPSQPTDTPPEPTGTPPVTDTPSAPTATAPPTATPEPTATATQPPTGEPLEIVGQGYEIVDWQELAATGEWEGHLRVLFTGGMAPYTFSLEHGPAQSENYLLLRSRRKCGAGEPVRVDVWSTDGQHAHRDLWVESPWCPTPTPTP